MLISATVLDACEKLGIIIPRFCYHELLGIAGNCRICLVEIEKSPKPQACCGLPVVGGIRIYTNTPLVKKSRESVLEFLLLNHPLDCPICDQGGECDLQNQTTDYGNNLGRFYMYKRGVEDKSLGPLIKTIINRCIHCTRCIRFAHDVAGIENLGTTLRGNNTEVGTYVQNPFNSEVSANIVDLCPVGALTSKVYAFRARPWEVKATISIDTTDSLGSNITIETINSRVSRVIPRFNRNINLEWLSDKARYAYSGNMIQRLSFPYFVKGQKLVKLNSKFTTLQLLSFTLATSTSLKFIVGKNLDLETLENFKSFGRRNGARIESENIFNISNITSITFQSTLSLEKINKAHSFLLLGVNPRSEASLAHTHLHKNVKKGGLHGASIGSSIDLTYECDSLGLCTNHLLNLKKGNHSQKKTFLIHHILIYGDSLSSRLDAFSLLMLNFYESETKRSIFFTLHFPLGCNSVGKSFLGISGSFFVGELNSPTSTSYLLKPENNAYLKKQSNNRIILETSHGTPFLSICNLILPLQSILEKNGDFMNHCGLIQKNLKVVRFGLEPLSYLSEFTSHYILPKFKSTEKYKKRVLFCSNQSTSMIKLGLLKKNLKLLKYPLKSCLIDSYRSDSNTSASFILAKVSQYYRDKAFHQLNTFSYK